MIINNKLYIHLTRFFPGDINSYYAYTSIKKMNASTRTTDTETSSRVTIIMEEERIIWTD